MSQEQNKLLSIIIPVYNTEKYIEKCLQSCLHQDLSPQKYEIIIVNDGTKDNSFEIAKKIAADKNNIILIDKRNGGASSARNEGLKIAQGKYIWFVDSDDWILENCLANLVYTLDINNLDVLQISYCNVIDGKTVLLKNPLMNGTSEVMAPQDYVNSLLFHPGIAATIFRREIAIENKIFFDEKLKWGEDQVFFLTLFYHSKRIKRENLLVYFYFNNSSSITNNTKPEFFFDIYDNLRIIKEKYGFTFHLSRSLVWILVYLMKHKNVDIKKLNNKLIELDIANFSRNLQLNNGIKFKISLYKTFGVWFLYSCKAFYSTVRFLRSKIINIFNIWK